MENFVSLAADVFFIVMVLAAVFIGGVKAGAWYEREKVKSSEAPE